MNIRQIACFRDLSSERVKQIFCKDDFSFSTQELVFILSDGNKDNSRDLVHQSISL